MGSSRCIKNDNGVISECTYNGCFAVVATNRAVQDKKLHFEIFTGLTFLEMNGFWGFWFDVNEDRRARSCAQR